MANIWHLTFWHPMTNIVNLTVQVTISITRWSTADGGYDQMARPTRSKGALHYIN